MQNLEIEFKNMLTEEEYFLLLQKFNLANHKPIIQENHYFDTSSFSLKNLGAALRIRQKENSFEMTLKQPASVGLLETNQTLTNEEALDAIHLDKLPGGIIQTIVEGLGISFGEMNYFGSLKTNRVEIEYEEGLLVLDHSFYLDKEDFELEYEVQNFQHGQVIFQELLRNYGIPVRKTENKIRRFYLQKYHQLP